MTPPRVAIVGAGITGAAIAWYLTKAGARVSIFELGATGGVATAGSLAWINAHRPEQPGYFGLRLKALRKWQALCDDISGLPVRFAGSLNWESSPDEMIALTKAYEAAGHKAKLIDGLAIRRLVPAIELPELAIWCPTEGLADPERIAHSILSAAIQAGAELHLDASVTAFERGGRKVMIEHGSDREFDHTIVAGGLGSVPLLKAVGFVLPLAPSPGLVVRTEPTDPLLRPFLAAPGVHFWQREDGRILAGADYAGSFEPERVDDTVNATLDLIRELFPGALIREEARTITDRPMPADGLPILGPVPDNDALSVAVLHSGITLAPMVGDLMAQWVVSGQLPDEMKPYKVSRF
ncbi:MAG: FAD-dependent oxidoreductase [Pseudomonadota bacterium]